MLLCFLIVFHILLEIDKLKSVNQELKQKLTLAENKLEVLRKEKHDSLLFKINQLKCPTDHEKIRKICDIDIIKDMIFDDKKNAGEGSNIGKCFINININ